MDYSKKYYDISQIYASLDQSKKSIDRIEFGDIWKSKASDKFKNDINNVSTAIQSLIDNIIPLLEAISYISLSETEDTKIRTFLAQIENAEFQENFAEIYDTSEYQEIVTNKQSSERLKGAYVERAKEALEKVQKVIVNIPASKKVVGGFQYDDLMDPISGTFKGYNDFSKSVKLLNVTTKSSGQKETKSTTENNTNTQAENMIKTAESCLGIKYVWGGSSPSTGFDCSGFVSWVINNSGNGLNYGRLNAEGLRQKCTTISASELQPGDLVFFQGTYDTKGASHVGIYVGDGKMIHCGNPVQYTSITSNYWKSHFLCYGRAT